jgi:hypothetical protein
MGVGFGRVLMEFREGFREIRRDLGKVTRWLHLNLHSRQQSSLREMDPVGSG